MPLFLTPCGQGIWVSRWHLWNQKDKKLAVAMLQLRVRVVDGDSHTDSFKERVHPTFSGPMYRKGPYTRSEADF